MSETDATEPSTTSTDNSENNRRAAAEQQNEGGFQGFLRGLLDIPILGGIVRMICGLFGMNFDTPATTTGGETPNTGTGGDSQQPANGQSQTPEQSNTDQARANAEALAAASGSTAAGTGTETTGPTAPPASFNPLPAATGPVVPSP